MPCSRANIPVKGTAVSNQIFSADSSLMYGRLAVEISSILLIVWEMLQFVAVLTVFRHNNGYNYFRFRVSLQIRFPSPGLY